MKRTILVPLLLLFFALTLVGCNGGEPQPLTPPDNQPGEYLTPPEDWPPDVWPPVVRTQEGDAPQTPAGAFDALTPIASTFNTGGVQSKPKYYPLYTPERDVTLRAVTTYHWHYGGGAIPGSVSIYDVTDGSETLLGTWVATARGGSGAHNVYWDVFPNIALQAGHAYRIVDSDPARWSTNNSAQYIGFSELFSDAPASANGKIETGGEIVLPDESNDLSGGDTAESAGVKVAADTTSLDLSKETLSAEDLEKLSSLQNLEELDLYRSNITDLTPLTSLRKLRSLDIGRTAVKDLAPLASLTELEALYFFGCGADLSPLTALPKLRTLDLANSSALDLSPLAQAQSLRRLSLASGHNVDFEGLSKLTQLESLDLSGVEFDDLTPLATLKNLTILELTAESAKDVTPLLGMTKLEDLSLCGEEENLDELAVLTNLKKLTFYSHGVVDNDAVEKVQEAIPSLVVDYPGQWGV